MQFALTHSVDFALDFTTVHLGWSQAPFFFRRNVPGSVDFIDKPGFCFFFFQRERKV